ncbi:DUF6180 family protein [Paracoccus aminovorans]|uniref:DUF6180 family protein n=1 Tax=Paracoccus aminovorans TaxID=34004 RepID=UPI002B2585F7|nr:DUF6180 family protein [Paracoccus aminovorans]
MTRSAWLLGAFGLLGSGFAAAAQDADFNVTYHVERTPAAQLSIETCGKAVVEVATQAGLRSATQSYPDQLVTISGGADGNGAFIVQCIAVGDTTVSVVQGIDYRQQKGALGAFADQAFAAVKAAAQ